MIEKGKERLDRRKALEDALLVIVENNTGNGLGPLIIGTIEVLGDKRSIIKTTEGGYLEVETSKIRIKHLK